MGCMESSSAKAPKSRTEPLKMAKGAKSGVHELKQNYKITSDTKILGSGAFGKVFLSHSI